VFRRAPGLEREIRADPRSTAAAGRELRRAVPIARRLDGATGGPWMPRKGHAQQIDVEDDPQLGPVLVNYDHLGHLKEWGGRNHAPRAILRRAVRAAGLRFRQLPK